MSSTPKARFPSKITNKKTIRSLQLRSKIAELSKAGNSPFEISKLVGVSKHAVYWHIKALLANGQLKPSETSYTHPLIREDTCRDWPCSLHTISLEIDIFVSLIQR